MATELSKSQIDRLGSRIRQGSLRDSDLKLLDEYRRSFGRAYTTVVSTIRNQLHLEPTGRPAKSTISIADKLLRESIRLTQIQDIAGCRIVVPDVREQDRAVGIVSATFLGSTVIDRRTNPSHGYRAVHIVVAVAAKLVEIQIRTRMQHVWAETSEKLSDTVEPSLKYGGGPEAYRVMLLRASSVVAAVEGLESSLVGEPSAEIRQALRELRTELGDLMNQLASSVESSES